ncbi:MAG: Dabb family protein [Acidobacteriia bacterium]|nr:Dabb family protein [Terriglobia bacterium]
MNTVQKRIVGILLGAVLLLAGIAAGGWREPSVSAQTKSAAHTFGQPKTVIHVVVYKWKEGLSEADKQKTLESIKEMAAQIPGIKNIWLKTQRNQLKDNDGVFVIEFTSAEAAADYAENPLHDAWSKRWHEVRQSSLSFQITNP